MSTSIVSITHPLTVVQCSPMSGVYGTSRYVGYRSEFIDKVSSHRYLLHKNATSGDISLSLDMAGELYKFYLEYRETVDKFPDLQFGSALRTLYATGSIAEATNHLVSMTTQSKAA